MITCQLASSPRVVRSLVPGCVREKGRGLRNSVWYIQWFLGFSWLCDLLEKWDGILYIEIKMAPWVVFRFVCFRSVVMCKAIEIGDHLPREEISIIRYWDGGRVRGDHTLFHSMVLLNRLLGHFYSCLKSMMRINVFAFSGRLVYMLKKIRRILR